MCWRVLAAVVVVLSVSCSREPAPSPTTQIRQVPTVSTSSTTSTTLPATTVATPPAGDELRVGTAVTLETLDAADAISLPDWELILTTGTALLTQDPATGEVGPGLAEDLPQVSEDGLTYTFHLRDDVVFSDGLQLTAPMYVESLQRVIDLGGRASDLVAGFVERVEATDEATVVLQLVQPFAFFPVVATSAAYVPVHPDIFPGDELVALPPAPLHGVGDWFITDMSETRVVLEPNPYRSLDPNAPSRVTLSYFPTSDEMTAAMAAGEVDMVWRGVDPRAEETLGQVDGVTVEHAPGGVLLFLAVNHDLSPTDDQLVRRALAQVIDREAVADDVLTGTVDPTYSPVPEGFLGSTDAFREVYGEPDVEAAIELLVEAGYTAEEPALLELGYPPERFGVDMARAMEEIEQQLEATGLIDVTLTAQAWNTYVGQVVDGTYHVAFLGWIFDFPDPHNYLAPFLLQGGVGGSAAGDADVTSELTAMVEEAAIEPDDQQRGELYESLQLRYAEEVVTLPLWIDPEAVAYWEHVQGDPAEPHPASLNIGPTLRLDYSSLRLDR